LEVAIARTIKAAHPSVVIVPSAIPVAANPLPLFAPWLERMSKTATIPSKTAAMLPMNMGGQKKPTSDSTSDAVAAALIVFGPAGTPGLGAPRLGGMGAGPVFTRSF